MKLKILITLLLGLLLFQLTIFNTSFILSAQQDVIGNGISVTPIRVQRNYKGNDKDVINFTLLNNENNPIDLSVTVKSFKLINNNLDVVFDSTVDETILNWIRNFDNLLTLNSKERVEYSLELNINADTPPGGYLFAIFFESQGENTSQNTEAVIKQSIGVPIIINIAGVAGISYGEISLSNFFVNYSLLSNSINTDITILNNSNQIITPAGVIKAKRLNGIGPDEVEVSFNNEGKIINSFSLRSYNIALPLNNRLAFGEYEVELNFLYGLENNVYTQKTKVWVIPPWSILIVVLILIAAIKLRNKRKSK
jgi:hypothetical protein